MLAAVGDDPFFAQGTDGGAVDHLYYSCITMATVGYGDLTPAAPLGLMVAAMTALLGQLYLVTFVALAVGNLGRERRQGRVDQPPPQAPAVEVPPRLRAKS